MHMADLGSIPDIIYSALSNVWDDKVQSGINPDLYHVWPSKKIIKNKEPEHESRITQLRSYMSVS